MEEGDTLDQQESHGGSAFAFKLICKIIWHLFSYFELMFKIAETFNHFSYAYILLRKPDYRRTWEML